MFTLYSALHKMKRSYIGPFVYLLEELGEAPKWPKDISRSSGEGARTSYRIYCEMELNLRIRLMKRLKRDRPVGGRRKPKLQIGSGHIATTGPHGKWAGIAV